ncbi:MAG TPA: hypothetical protein H9746_02460 [Candidatus Butyricicoccus avistercoris]|uniref:Uncharacterized protein n=1 Tax=Candidatus Butyricicoccus avistercoris TaxID=2838518 RepID=A0A9D1PGJ0_9FIRM|nr:hypothetical protein [Candidatus Butyricicoccus avistercoris]
MNKIDYSTMFRKIVIYCLGLFIMAMGVSFSGSADLGMSPVNSIPYVLSEIFTQLSMGTWIIIIFSLYILIQFIILGKNIQPTRILQLICTTIFGYFTDFTNMLADKFLPDPASFALPVVGVYGVRLVYLFISMVLIALIISLLYFKQFHGIREGTVIAAFGVGKILGFYEPLKPKVYNLMYGSKQKQEKQQELNNGELA